MRNLSLGLQVVRRYLCQQIIRPPLHRKRKRLKRGREIPTGDLPEHPVLPPNPETRIVVLDALATLPPRARAVVVLRYWEDLSVDQVADMLGCSAGNVKSQSARALGKLRAVLDGTVAGSGSPGHPQEAKHHTEGIEHG